MPVLDYSALEPGRATTDVIKQTSQDLRLDRDYQARVRQTGLVPINDDEFASLREDAGLYIAVSILGVLVALLLALHWRQIVLAVAACLLAGIAMSLVFGLPMFGALNLISVAFFALFAGIGVDFGIQFSVRYRTERHELGDLHSALQGAKPGYGHGGCPAPVVAAAGIPDDDAQLSCAERSGREARAHPHGREGDRSSPHSRGGQAAADRPGEHRGTVLDGGTLSAVIGNRVRWRDSEKTFWGYHDW
jgi:MMPL family